uniref:Putative retrotransposon protein n=1 Tax=Tanacetum cinerariifolium TaxID=118510 RepID=A0A6L2NPN5_TANCI|nr:putative retrotransposon protein [Tanacetum cinerariifolium]
MHIMGKIVNKLHAMLMLHEQTLPKSNAPALNVIQAGKVQKGNKHKKSQSQIAARGQNHEKGKYKQAYAPKPKIPPPPKRENPTKDSICHGTQLLVLVVQGLRASRKLKPGALSLYVRNGQREAVEAIDAFYLCLLSGLEIVLNNCHYASSITRGIISVSRFAIIKDGIFEIDLSNSLTNESYIYAVSNKRAKLDLDSALLWYYRLGHISKKRIKKLQHDGLLDSSNLRAFKKCFSCMSGKMAGKPYTHQMEKAKDLLGLIHTDERRNKTLLDMVRSMMSQTTLLKSFWDYALVTAAHILNMVPTKKVEKTPYEVWHEKAPKLSYLKVWGCEALVKSTRTRHAPDRMCLYIDAEEHGLGDLGEPVNYKAALLDPESKKWLNAMNVEMQSMKDNEIWVLVELPPNGKTVGSKWHFKKKTDMDGNEELKLSKSQGASTPAKLKRMKNVPYASAVGSIMYVVRCTRPDVAFAQNVTSRFQQNLGDIHWTTVKNIMKYLRNTKDMFLVYGGDLKRDLRVSCYTNAGYLTDADDLKSKTRYVFVLNGGAVDWKSVKQSIFATSSAKAEYITAFDASKEAVWVRKFISGLGVVPTIKEPISMYCDNT